MNGIAVKFGLALVALIIALLAGVYLSGYLLPMLLKVHVSTPWYATWWSYYKAIDLPQVAPYAGKIKLATALGFGLPLLVLLPLGVLALKTRDKALHGDARFANSGDLARKDMFKPSPTGIVVGKFGGKLLRLPGQQFVILAAPTRSGKGVGIVIPNLLDYTESMVVLDIKQENFDLTSGWRASQGQEIYLFNPFAEDRRTHRWNPLTYVSRDPAFRVSDLASIAAMLYPDGADDQKFWVSQARNAFMAFALYLFEELDRQIAEKFPADWLRYPTLGALYRLSSGDGTDLKQYLRERADKPFLSGEARTTFANLLSQEEKTFASIMGTFKEPLNAFINPILDAATSADDFLLSDVRKRRMTIYIGIQPDKLAESRLIVNLFFSQLINQNTRELPQNNKALKHQCLLLMDEFTSIGKVEIISTAIAYMAGYNIRLLPIIQSMAQLDAVYGKDVSRTMITNHALQIVYAPREQQDANDYSEMLGYTTIRKRNRSRSYGQQGNTTLSENEERRALMLPQELKAMGFDKEVFFYEGIPHPVLCEKIKYFKDSYFTSRLLPKVKIKALEILVPGKALQIPPEPPPVPPEQVANAADTNVTTHSQDIQETDDMKLSQIAATAALAAGALTACLQPPTPVGKRNPHPHERYEVLVKVENAPGPMELVSGVANYQVTNEGCLAVSNDMAGYPIKPDNVIIELSFDRIADNEFRGEVVTDAMLNEDYNGRGICRWEPIAVGPTLKGSKGALFGSGPDLRELRSNEPRVVYYLKTEYFAPDDFEKIPGGSINLQPFGTTNRSYFASKREDELFTITYTARKIAP